MKYEDGAKHVPNRDDPRAVHNSFLLTMAHGLLIYYGTLAMM
jgi:hypothetical protein